MGNAAKNNKKTFYYNYISSFGFGAIISKLFRTIFNKILKFVGNYFFTFFLTEKYFMSIIFLRFAFEKKITYNLEANCFDNK